MFGWEFPPFNSGGLGVACEGLTRALRRRGIQVVFVLPKKLDIKLGFIRFAAPAGSEKQVAVNAVLSPYLTSGLYDERLKVLSDRGFYGENVFSEVYRYGERAAMIARGEKFDIIHAHDWLSYPAGIAAKRASGKPLVMHVHATEYDRTGGNRPDWRILEIEKEGFLAADLVIAVSGFVRDAVISRYGISPEKVVVCHNGIDPREPFYSALPALKRAGRKIVLFVGRLTLQKGPDYFLRAARLVLAHEPKALFVVAGSGDMERRLIEDSALLGLRDRVIFTGFLRGYDLDRLYHLADVFVMPSVSEPFGLTALEAAQAGVPAVISRQSGVKEVMKHALLADFWDIRALAERILGLLRYAPLREMMRVSAQKETENITWDRAAETLLHLYGRFA